MLSYKALYRKYRPQNLVEVVGQEHVVTTLKNIIINNQTSHAYLFSGPRGTGKTSVALAFAKTLNCTNLKENNVPCKNCKQCQSVKNSLDIIEIDAASNNGVAEIRNLIDNVKYAPSISKYKVYIIDEVHMLSKGAFNALLKTLEEPPKYVIFILATTEPHKIPSTIISRTQRFNFHKIDNAVIKKHLETIMAKESFTFDQEALNLIVKLANGSIRDSLSVLDQVAAYSNGKIYFESISQVFGITSVENQISLLNLLFNSQIKQVLQKVNNWISNGIDITRLVSSIVELLKDYIVFVQTNELSLLENISKQEISLLKISKDFAYKSLDLFIDLLSSLRISALPKQIFEITILKVLDLNKNQADRQHLVKEDVFNGEEKEESFSPQEDKNDFLKEQESEEIQKETVHFEKSLDQTKEEVTNFDITNRQSEEETIDDLFKTTDVDLKTKTLETSLEIQENDLQEEKINDNQNISNSNQQREEILGNNLEKTNEFVKESLENVENDQNAFEGDQDNIDILDVFKVDEDTKTLNIDPQQIVNSPKYEPLSLNEVINVLLQSNKQYLENAKNKLSLIDQYSHNIEFGNFVTTLQNTKIIASGDGFLLVSSEKDSIIHALEDFVQTESFIKLTNLLFNYPQKFFPITKEVFLQAKEKWINLKANNNLPEVNKIEKLNPLPEKENEVEEFATSIFGDAFEK